MSDVIPSEELSEQYWLDVRGIKKVDDDIQVTNAQVQAILHSIGIEGPVHVTTIHEYNHVCRIECAGETFFLKIFTKSWYIIPEESAYCVGHERSAWLTLA